MQLMQPSKLKASVLVAFFCNPEPCCIFVLRTPYSILIGWGHHDSQAIMYGKGKIYTKAGSKG